MKKNLKKGRSKESRAGRLIKKENSFPVKCLFLLFVLFILCQPVFAQTINVTAAPTGIADSGLSTILGYILWFFGSIYMKSICIIALVGICIGILTNRGEPGMFKKFLPWGIGFMILLSASWIVNALWKPNFDPGTK
jgi:hypothetical protein